MLEGVTRETALELRAELDIPAEERPLHPYDAYTADEMFLTSTASGFVPVRVVDGRTVGDGRPGPTFRRLKDAYQSLNESGTHCTRSIRECRRPASSSQGKRGGGVRGEGDDGKEQDLVLLRVRSSWGTLRIQRLHEERETTEGGRVCE